VKQTPTPAVPGELEMPAQGVSTFCFEKDQGPHIRSCGKLQAKLGSPVYCLFLRLELQACALHQDVLPSSQVLVNFSQQHPEI
jgi:hypothetical protein